MEYSEDELAKIAVNECFKIHKHYGPGMFERIYEEILCYELQKMGIGFSRQQRVRVIHDGCDMGIGFIPDIILEDKIILEIKLIEKILTVHYKQLISYLKLTHLKLGLLINFNEPLIKNGIHRIVNKL
jgi:GxxExxY protein